MLSKISSLVGGDGVFPVVRQAETSGMALALQGLAKALSLGGRRLDALISNPLAQTQGPQDIPRWVNGAAERSAEALRCVFGGEHEALTELKSDLHGLFSPNHSSVNKKDMAAFLKKHVDRKP